ncbi:MAG TPA: DUF2934 domain-containing protein [Burkholderiales bacterium]|nr:DUF2934 domain-containing protein [Burkholderiales bacterium]
MAADALKTPAWQGTKKTLETLIHPLVLSENEVRQMIAAAAYYRAERRGFAPGGEVEDWLAAEKEVAQRLNAMTMRTSKLDAPSAQESAAIRGSAPAHQPTAPKAKPERKRAPRRRTKE